MYKIYKYQVIIPSDISPLPETHEVSAAQIISNFLNSNAEFIVRNNHKVQILKLKEFYGR